MFVIFGTGKKYIQKKEGKTISQKCPNCGKYGAFREVIAVEYVSFFFIPILTDDKQAKNTKSYFECPNCNEKYAFAGIRFAQAHYASSFFGYLARLFAAFKNMRSRAKEKSKKRKMARDVEVALKKMKRTIIKEKSKGDRNI